MAGTSPAPTGAGINVVDDDVEKITLIMSERVAAGQLPVRMRINSDAFSTFTTDTLQVDGHPLPNIPIEVAPAT